MHRCHPKFKKIIQEPVDLKKKILGFLVLETPNLEIAMVFVYF